MRKALLGTILWASIWIFTPEDISNFDNNKVIREVSKKTQIILELKEKQETSFKIKTIQESIDKWIDKNETRAFLIWVSENMYNNTTLWTPWNDIKTLKRLLIKKYWLKKENITLLLDWRATKKKILSEMKRIEKLTPDDKKMIVYFSWHWIALDERWREVKDYKSWNYSWYITPYDAIPYSKKRDNYKEFLRTRISRAELNDAIWWNQNNLFILDSCFGWAMAKGSKPNEVLVAASNKEEAIGTRRYSKRKTSLFSNAIFQEIVWNNNNSIWWVITNSRNKINELVIIEKSLQEPIIKTNKLTMNIRKNKVEEWNN